MDLSKREYTKDALDKKDNSKVIVAGWVERIKLMGNLAFINLRDMTGILQIVAKGFNDLGKLTPESVIVASGTIKKGQKKSGEKELILDNYELINKAETPLPVDLVQNTTQLDKRIDYRFLDTRNPKISAIFKIRSEVFRIVVDFFSKEGFVNINTPKITASGVESGAELFEINYFNKKAYLSQSPQIYKQMMVAAGFERVYEIAPVFRAEKSHTTRHLTEFTGIDMEVGFIQDENSIMDIVENLMNYVVKNIKNNCKNELELLNVKLEIPKKIPRIQMKDVKLILKKEKKNLSENDDLDAESERLISTIVKKKYDNDFVFVTDYPWTKRPFYHMKPENDKKGTRSFDLIWNGVEVGTGAQREHRYHILKEQAKEKGIDLDRIKGYAEIFKFGCPPHGGVGLGLDRMVQCLLKLENVRESILLPRDTERLTP